MVVVTGREVSKVRRMRIALLAGLAAVGFLAGPAMAKGEGSVITGSAIISGPRLPGPVILGGYFLAVAGQLGQQATLPSNYEALLNELGLRTIDARTSGDWIAAAPVGPLGPRYEVTYLTNDPAFGTQTLRQEVYPSAHGGPVAHFESGGSFLGNPFPEGWYAASPALAKLFRTVGVLRTASAAPIPAPAQPAATPAPPLRTWLWAVVLGGVLALVSAGAVAARRRRAVRVL
jgi:hypothetical protein